jgi:exopolysaccharide biosynthesis WecB/TagA/CpsF family protein
MSGTIDCLGVPVARLTWPEFVAWFEARAAERRPEGPSRLYIVNAHTLNLAWEEPAYRSILLRADLILNDGIGLDLAVRLEGTPFFYNFNGTDLFPRVLAELGQPERPLKVFLYGAVPGRAETVAGVIASRYPNVEVVGVRDGYAKDDAETVALINAASPDLLLVAKGNPLQERWLDTHGPALRVGVAAGVGALFDFMSGAVDRAPEWVRTVRAEWMYRLAIEPKRMFNRYVIGNPVFLARAVRHKARRGLGR